MFSTLIGLAICLICCPMAAFSNTKQGMLANDADFHTPQVSKTNFRQSSITSLSCAPMWVSHHRTTWKTLRKLYGTVSSRSDCLEQCIYDAECIGVELTVASNKKRECWLHANSPASLPSVTRNGTFYRLARRCNRRRDCLALWQTTTNSRSDAGVEWPLSADIDTVAGCQSACIESPDCSALTVRMLPTLSSAWTSPSCWLTSYGDNGLRRSRTVTGYTLYTLIDRCGGAVDIVNGSKGLLVVNNSKRPNVPVVAGISATSVIIIIILALLVMSIPLLAIKYAWKAAVED